jgi:hypothetical protein
VKHHLADTDDRVLFLGDVVALAPPVAQAVSVGDFYTYGGVAVVIIAAMRRRPDEAADTVTVTDTARMRRGAPDEVPSVSG